MSQHFNQIMKNEATSGIILFIAAVLAMIIANSPLNVYYQDLFNMIASIHLGLIVLSKPLILWINDGLMAIFFLLVGLEIKYEIYKGELNTKAKATLPGIAALGGMVCPAIIYLIFNHHDKSTLEGWAIPTATDIAFSLGILALLGSRIPKSLKIFLTALAIFDDIGAIIIIALFYTANISFPLLIIASILCLLLLVLNRLNVTLFLPYCLIGIILWICVLKSGVHATLTGIVLAFAIPVNNKKKPTVSPIRELEHQLRPWVHFLVLPIFAFANAGVNLSKITLEHLTHSIPLGIALGLFIGKQIGIWGFTTAAIKLKLITRPEALTSTSLYGISLIAGVGFTMSLFIGSLCFENNAILYSPMVKLGVLSGSILSGLLGYIILSKHFPKTR